MTIRTQVGPFPVLLSHLLSLRSSSSTPIPYFSKTLLHFLLQSQFSVKRTIFSIIIRETETQGTDEVIFFRLNFVEVVSLISSCIWVLIHRVLHASWVLIQVSVLGTIDSDDRVWFSCNRCVRNRGILD